MCYLFGVGSLVFFSFSHEHDVYIVLAAVQ